MPQDNEQARVPVDTDSDEIGDSHAPPGSLPWRKSYRHSLIKKHRDALATAIATRDHLRDMRERGFYIGLPDRDGNGFTDWNTFCAAKPPWGLGKDPAGVNALIEAETAEAIFLAVKHMKHAIHPPTRPMRRRRNRR